jgi:Raf kinase inhibitor-like YbhB/YbcL family protein
MSVDQEPAMHLRSPAFRDGDDIPSKFTHDGADVSPPLEWDDVPEAAKSLALVVEDPDVADPSQPGRLWIHWIVVDLPPDSGGLAEGVRHLPNGVMGLNDWDRPHWNGPSPPKGRHHYIFKLYALDRRLGLARPTKYDLDRALTASVVLAEAKLVGLYQRRKAA